MCPHNGKEKLYANEPFAAGNQLQTLIFGVLRDLHTQEPPVPPNAHEPHDKAPKTMVQCSVSCPQGSLKSAKSCKIGTEKVRNQSDFIFGPPMRMGLCHGMGASAWHVGYVFAGL